MKLTAQKGKRQHRKKDQRSRLNLGPTLYRGVSATRATETGRDPSSPITLMHRSQVCHYPACSQPLVHRCSLPFPTHGYEEVWLHLCTDFLCVSYNRTSLKRTRLLQISAFCEQSLWVWLVSVSTLYYLLCLVRTLILKISS